MKSAVGALGGDPLGGVQEQAKAIRRYAKGRGVAIGETYMDAGASGVTLNRAGLQKLLADCRAGKIRTVITQDPDRLSRDIGQLLMLYHELCRAGVRIQYSTPGGSTHHKLTMLVATAIADFGSQKARPKKDHAACE
jgi:DNA invertase Pin-like site-specific DNA recombinase